MAVLVLHVNLAAGHSGKSGRYERLQDRALEFAFLLQLLHQPDRRAPATPRSR